MENIEISFIKQIESLLKSEPYTEDDLIIRHLKSICNSALFELQAQKKIYYILLRPDGPEKVKLKDGKDFIMKPSILLTDRNEVHEFNSGEEAQNYIYDTGIDAIVITNL